jgi:hypothetical protein
VTGSERAHALIIGSEDDPHAAAVAEAVERYMPVVLLDVASLEHSRFTVTPTETAVGTPSEPRATLLQPGRGWVRRVAPADWDANVVVGSTGAAVKASWLALLSAVVRISVIEWLTDPTAAALAENKLLQYAAAARCGLPFPATVVTSEPSMLRRRLGDKFVLKPLGPAQVLEGGEARAVFSTAVRWDDPVLATLVGAPFIAQELILARRHLRVVTVRERAWVGALEVDTSTPLDWRLVDRTHTSFAQVDHPDVCRNAVALAHEMNVGYSSQDWVEDGSGGTYFLDLNPGGQWLFLPFAEDVTGAIARWLEGPHEQND